jgi:hypothetical protein
MKAVRKYDIQTNKAPDTGALLKAFFKKRRISKAALARTLNRASKTLVGFVKRSSIQTAVLWEICHALKHNFFADIAAQLPATYTTNDIADNTQTERIAQLEHENALLQAKYDALVEVMRK